MIITTLLLFVLFCFVFLVIKSLVNQNKYEMETLTYWRMQGLMIHAPVGVILKCDKEIKRVTLDLRCVYVWWPSETYLYLCILDYW